MSKVCKYGCGVELGQYNTSENKFLETDNKTLHIRDRCESLKQQKVVNDWANEKQQVQKVIITNKLIITMAVIAIVKIAFLMLWI